MYLFTYVLAAGLAALFVISGTAKLRDLPSTARHFRALGLPFPYPLARGVAVVELADALLLLVLPGAVAFVAAVALLAFTAVLVDGLRRGVDSACGCFGGRSARPISWRDVARNLVLLAAAGAVVVLWRLDPIWS